MSGYDSTLFVSSVSSDYTSAILSPGITTFLCISFHFRCGAVVKGVEHISYGRRTYFDNCGSQHLSGAGSSPTGSVGRDLNLQKLNYQYLTTSVAVILVVR